MGRPVTMLCGRCKSRKPIKDFARSGVYCRECAAERAAVEREAAARRRAEAQVQRRVGPGVRSVVRGGLPSLGKRK